MWLFEEVARESSVAAFNFRNSPVSGSADQGQEIVPTVNPQGFRQPYCKRGKRIDTQPPSSSTRICFDKSNPTGHSNSIPPADSCRMSGMISWCSNTDSALDFYNRSKPDGPVFSSQRHSTYLKHSLRNAVKIIHIVL